jgi:hypothetical protein
MARKKKVLKPLPNEHQWAFTIGWASDFEVTVIITPDIIASRKHRNEILGVFEQPRCGQKYAAFFSAVGGYGYLFLPPVFDPDTVAHETYHLVDYMMDRLGVTQRDGEVMAYHLGWIVGKVSEVYLRVSKLTKKADKRVDTEFEN